MHNHFSIFTVSFLVYLFHTALLSNLLCIFCRNIDVPGCGVILPFTMNLHVIGTLFQQ